jgi:hypothetical protein
VPDDTPRCLKVPELIDENDSFAHLEYVFTRAMYLDCYVISFLKDGVALSVIT